MKQITLPISVDNVAEVVAERDAEIERLQREVSALRLNHGKCIGGIELVEDLACPRCGATSSDPCRFDINGQSGEDGN